MVSVETLWAVAALEQLTVTTQMLTENEVGGGGLGGLSGNSVGRGSSGAAYFYHTGELTSTAHCEVGVGRSWWSKWKLCGLWQPLSSLLLPHR